jgi:hypothetical protein
MVAELSKQHSGLSIRTSTKRISAIYLIPGLLYDVHAQNYDLNLMTFLPLVVMIAWIRLMKWVILLPLTMTYDHVFQLNF